MNTRNHIQKCQWNTHQNKNLDLFSIMCTNIQTHTCSAVLVTRPWCSLRACFWEKRWVWLFLSRARWICTHKHIHTHRENKQGERGEEMTGVYKAQCAGDRRQVHLHGNKETGEREFWSPKINAMPLIYFLDSAGGSVHCLIILCKRKMESRVPQGLMRITDNAQTNKDPNLNKSFIYHIYTLI